MLTVRSSVFFFALVLLVIFADVHAAPQRGSRRKGKGAATAAANTQTLQQQAAQVPQGVSQATDGSTILDTTATVK